MEETRALLDSAERGKRQTEAELAEARAAVNQMNTINSKVGSVFHQLAGLNKPLAIFCNFHRSKGVERQAFPGEQRAHDPGRDGGDADAGKE